MSITNNLFRLSLFLYKINYILQENKGMLHQLDISFLQSILQMFLKLNHQAIHFNPLSSHVTRVMIVEVQSKNHLAQLFDNIFILAVQKNIPHELITSNIRILYTRYLYYVHQSLYFYLLLLLVLEKHELFKNMELINTHIEIIQLVEITKKVLEDA